MTVRRDTRTTCLLAVAVSLALSRGNGDEAIPLAVSPERVSAIVDSLSADTLAERVAAEQMLLQLGPAALPLLPNPQTVSPSVADAVRRIRRQLEEREARQALRPGAVTFHETASLVEILSVVASQTGNRVSVSELPLTVQQRRLTVNFDETPFWQAVRNLEQQASILIRPGPDPRSLEASFRAEDKEATLPSAVVGPFRIDVVGAAMRTDFTNPHRRILRLTLEALHEPRLRLLFAHTAAADLTVTDGAAAEPGETLQTFPPLNPQSRLEVPLDKPGPVRLIHDVILEEEDSPASVTLQGTVVLELAVAEHQFVFRHLNEPAPIIRRHGGIRVTLENVDLTRSDLQAALRLEYDSDGPRFESHRNWVFHNDVRLVIGEDQHRPTQSESLSAGDGGATLRYRFADAIPLPDDAQLHYTAPTLITRVPVKFSIQEISIGE